MNNKIKELAEEAGLVQGVMGLNRFTHFDPEKFAELIISECCVALHPMLRNMISRTQGVDMIVEHFKDKE